jgi:hypothetical protein
MIPHWIDIAFWLLFICILAYSLSTNFAPFGPAGFVAFGSAYFVFDDALGAFGAMAARGERGRVRGGSGEVWGGKRIDGWEK